MSFIFTTLYGVFFVLIINIKREGSYKTLRFQVLFKNSKIWQLQVVWTGAGDCPLWVPLEETYSLQFVTVPPAPAPYFSSLYLANIIRHASLISVKCFIVDTLSL